MKNTPHKRYGWLIWILLGISSLAGAGYIAMENYVQDRDAGITAESILDGMDQIVVSTGQQRTAGNVYEPVMAVDTEEIVIPDMPTVEVDGYSCIGTLEVPDVEMRLPVIAEFSEEDMLSAPCHYSGSYYTDDLVIVGHSFKSHMRPIWQADIGADVYFTNADGEVYHYIISNIETLDPQEVSRMVENDQNSDRQNADWDLTIFTCTPDTSARYTVRCIRDKEYGRSE